MDDHGKRHDAIEVSVIAAYGVIAKILLALPLPIAIPTVIGSMYADQIHEDLITAHRIMADIPMDDGIRQWTREMILDWITAVDMMFEDAQDPEPWKLDFVDTQIARVLATGRHLRGELTNE